MNTMNTTIARMDTHQQIVAIDIARIFGKEDAEDGDLCVPEKYFADLGRQQAYVRGYESVAGPTLAGEWFLRGAK